MEQNGNILTPEASTDERASFVNSPAAAEAPQEPEPWDFPSKEAEDAYWAGFMDGTRNAGGKVEPRLAARARDVYPELLLTPQEKATRPGDALDFDPVATRHRIDGWTPEKQREYVEALADSGVARYAAARVGMSEQSANRLRRRSDARSFDLACQAGHRIGARRLRSVAFDRAIEGTVRKRYWRGEVVGEDRVYDNKLLVYLLGKTEAFADPPEETRQVEENWEAWMDAVEQGADPPGPAAAAEPVPELEPDPEPKDPFTGKEVWQKEDGSWWTSFPPPAGFAGDERDVDLHDDWSDYERELSPAELAVIESELVQEQAEHLAGETRLRDLYFGFRGGERSLPAEPELYELSAAAGVEGPGEGEPAG